MSDILWLCLNALALHHVVLLPGALQCTVHATKVSTMHAGLCLPSRLELQICTGYAEPMPAHRQRSRPRHRARYRPVKEALYHHHEHMGSLTHV